MDVFRGTGIYGCPQCRKLWIYSVEEVSGNAEFLLGDRNWRHSLAEYTPDFMSYKEMRERFDAMRICRYCFKHVEEHHKTSPDGKAHHACWVSHEPTNVTGIQT